MDTTLNGTLPKSMSSDRLDKIQPCFLFDSEQFKCNLAHFYNSFAECFGEYGVITSFSTKTNPDFNVLRAVCESPNWMIEIVSPHEMELAHGSGFSNDRIVYNGVIPDVEGKFLVAENGGIVNVENYSELKELSDYAKKRKTPIEVGLRVNITVDSSRKWKSRFGIEPHTEQFSRCLDLQNDYLKIVGLHSHIHGCRTLNFWKKRATVLGMLGKEIGVKYIDFGSNMFGFMDSRLADQFECDIPTTSDYAREIHDQLELIYEDENIPNIIVEPGTPVVANTVSVLGKVESIAERCSDTIATASCSVYDFGFFHGSDKHPPMDVIHMNEGKYYEDVEIFGYACTEDDTVCNSYTGNLAIGDFLMFRNLGAYANSLCSNFIKPKLITYDIETIK